MMGRMNDNSYFEGQEDYSWKYSSLDRLDEWQV